MQHSPAPLALTSPVRLSLIPPSAEPLGLPTCPFMHPAAAAEARGIGAAVAPGSAPHPCQCIPSPCLSAAGSLSETDLPAHAQAGKYEKEDERSSCGRRTASTHRLARTPGRISEGHHPGHPRQHPGHRPRRRRARVRHRSSAAGRRFRRGRRAGRTRRRRGGRARRGIVLLGCSDHGTVECSFGGQYRPLSYHALQPSSRAYRPPSPV